MHITKYNKINNFINLLNLYYYEINLHPGKF